MYIHSNLLNSCSYKLCITIERQCQFDRSEMGSHSDRRFTGKELGWLNQRHNTHVAYAGKVYGASAFLYTTLTVLSILFWYSCITLRQSSWQLTAWLSAAATTFFCTLVNMTVFHEASHFAITHKPWVWRASTSITDGINGMSSLIEIYQHTYGHHIFTNIAR